MDDAYLSKGCIGNEGRGAGGQQEVQKNGMARVAEHWRFFSAFLRRPAAVGAVAPSSSFLATALLRYCDFRNGVTVVELGPGTGAVTRHILPHLGHKATFFAMELDGPQSRQLQSQFPGTAVYNDSAEQVKKYLDQHGRAKADFIVSSLPWGNMPGSVQDRILDAVLGSLSPGGVFSTYAYLHSRYLPTGRHLRKRLHQHFKHVETSQVVWRNVPPAFVYYCR